MMSEQIAPDAPVHLQVVLHGVCHTQVVSGQRAKKVFIPGEEQRRLD